MAVDSRAKGQRGEYQVRDLLKKYTNQGWERVPGSGAFGVSHGLKGDVYLPDTTGKKSLYCFEVKWYKDDQLTSNIFNITESMLEKWWLQCVREAGEMNMKPALVFKKDRGKWLVALDAKDVSVNKNITYMQINKGTALQVVITDFESWVKGTEKLYE